MTNLSESRHARQDHDQPMPALGYEAAKRTLDVVVSVVAILALAPLLGALCLLTLWTSPGPALFRQERLGRRMRPFTTLKLRTMYTDASDELHRDYVANLVVTGDPGPVTGQRGLLKLEADPRITPVGAWLRRTSLDELPQLFNVLSGDMSLVGPRPALAWEAAMLPASYPAYVRRFEVKPGMTGLWQVSGRSMLSMRKTFELDAEYVRRRGFLLDLIILVRTVPAVLRGGTA